MARLTKSRNQWIDGVLGGVGEYFQINPDLLRIIFLAAVLIFRAHFLITIYIILLIFLPGPGRASVDEESEMTTADFSSTGESGKHTERRAEWKASVKVNSGRTLQFFGALLVIVGVAYLIKFQFPNIWNNLRYYSHELEYYLRNMREVLIGVFLIAGGIWLLSKNRKK